MESEFHSQRVLILAPTGNDGSVLKNVLANEQIEASICENMEQLCSKIEEGAGSAIIAEEALYGNALIQLAQTIDSQPEWSDFPVIVMSSASSDPDMTWAVLGGGKTLNSNVLRRPVLTKSLMTAIRASLRSRNQQYQIADELDRRRKAEEAIRRSEAQFRQLADAMPQLVWITRADGYYEYFNNRWYEFTGTKPGETVGEMWAQLLHPDDYQRTLNLWHHSLQSGEPYSIEYRFKRGSDGTYHWFIGRALPVHNEQGKIIKWFGTCTYIQEQKEAQEALHKSETRLNTILDILPVGVLLADAQGRITRVNPAARITWGIPPETRSIEHYNEWVGWWPDTGKRIKAEEWAMARVLRTGEVIRNVLLRNKKFGSNEQRYILNNAVPFREDGGRIIGGVVTIIDVTDLRKTEDALRESEEKFRAVFELAAVGMGRVSFSDAKWIDVNAAFCRMLGYSAEEFKSTPWPDITHPDDINLDIIPFKQMSTGKLDSYSVEKRFLHKDGHYVWARLTLSLVRDERGHPDYEIAIIENISEQKQAQMALVESEERFRTLADNISQFTWMADSKGWIFWFNKRWFDYSGTTREEMQGWGWKKLLHPDYADRVVKKIQQSWDTGAFWEDTFPLKSKDGSYRWFLSRAIPIRNEHGDIIRWFGTNTDVTEFRILQEQLTAERELLQTIIESIPVMITLYDPQIQKIQFNKAFEKVTGWTDQDARTRPLIELVYPDPDYRKGVSDYMQSLTPGFRDLVMTGKNGDCIDTSWANVRIPDGRQVGIGLDIRERLKNEKALKRSEERWNLAIESIDTGVIIATEDEQVIYWNPVARVMYGIKSANENIEPLEKTSSKFELWTPDRNHLLELDEWPMRRIKRGEKVSKYELLIRRPDQGWEKIFSYSGTMVELTGGERLIFLTVQDLTELRKAEQQLRNSNQELESFSYSVAHDLRNPLNTIKGFISLLMEDCSDKLDNDCKDYVNRISTGAERMNSIIDDILALSKISRQEIAISSVDLSKMAYLTIDELRKMQPDNRPEVIIQEGLSVNADARLMSVILGNLLGNAWKYTSKTFHPRIEFGALEKENKRVYFVKDNGAGFDMSKSADLFTPFKRLHSDSEFKGIGIGLAIVDRAIKRHGGKIWAESKPGEGATFYFTLR